MGDNILFVESYEREELSYTALLTTDIITTLVREYGVQTVRYVNLVDIINHCLNFIYLKMPSQLKVEYIIEYVNTSLPMELRVDNYKKLSDWVNHMKDEKEDIVSRIDTFKELRLLFSIAVIEELQLCNCIERYDTLEDREKNEETNIFLIRNLSSKKRDGNFKYGIHSFDKSNRYYDKRNEVGIHISDVDKELRSFKFEVRDKHDKEILIKGEFEEIGILVYMMITKYLHKKEEFEIILDMILNVAGIGEDKT